MKKIISAIFLGLLLCSPTQAQNIQHNWHVFDRGGGKATSGGIVLHSSIGQPFISRRTPADTGNIMEGGFIPGFRLYYGSWMVLNFAFSEGWNLVSLPLMPLDQRISSLYPSASSNAFAYTTSYVPLDTIRNGIGFWLKYPVSISETLLGTGYFHDTIDVNSGWNIVGVPTSAVPVANISTIGTSVLTEYFGYDDSYYAEDTLYPGKGYWLKTSNAGRLILASVPMAMSRMDMMALSDPALKKLVVKKDLKTAGNDVSQIRFKDALHRECRLYFSDTWTNPDLNRYELPPPPPNEAFDVRYKTNRFLEVADPEKGKTTIISVTSALFPLSIEWKISSGVGGGTLVLNGKEFKLISDGSVTVYELKSMPRLRLNPSRLVELPKEFALHQNYPNPFNPTTRIKYDQPVDSRVAIKIYNLLGQEVAVLVNEASGAGHKSVDWDAGSLPSGMYICRLTAGAFSDVKKMILVR